VFGQSLSSRLRLRFWFEFVLRPGLRFCEFYSGERVGIQWTDKLDMVDIHSGGG